MVIATSITQPYLEKSKPFLDSVQLYMPGIRRICFTIGFVAVIDGWECVEVQPECTWRPKNRDDYYSLQHGEFIKHATFEANEMILFCDSDMVLQREWDLQMPPTDSILLTQSSWPQTKLMDVVKNIGCRRRIDKVLKKWGILVQREFCACFIIAKARTWERIYRHAVDLYPMLNDFTHHSAWQLLLNVIIHNNFHSHIILPEHICNAGWYEGTGAKYDNGILKVQVQGKDVKGELVSIYETVYFNHTKFNVY